MIFKRIDRYVGLGFVFHFVASVALIAGLFVGSDMLKGAGEYREGGLEGMSATLRYYGYLLPNFLSDLVPALVLVAAGMVLVRMAKRREILALKASGTSLYRTTAPIFLWALILSVAAFGVRETAGPRFAKKAALLSRARENEVERQLLLADAEFNRRIFIGQYQFATGEMEAVFAVELGPEGRLARTLRADYAVWTRDGGLALSGVTSREFDPEGETVVTAVPSRKIGTSLKPFDIVQAAEEEGDRDRLYHSLPELLSRAEREPGVPYYRVTLHARTASFFGPLLLLLIGIPSLVGFERSVNSIFLGVIVCILLASTYYLLTFVFTSMGHSGTINAPLAGWLPVIVMGSAGLWLFESMHT